MKILVVGGGGREHAIIRSLKKNPNIIPKKAILNNIFDFLIFTPPQNLKYKNGLYVEFTNIAKDNTNKPINTIFSTTLIQ